MAEQMEQMLVPWKADELDDLTAVAKAVAMAATRDFL